MHDISWIASIHINLVLNLFRDPQDPNYSHIHWNASPASITSAAHHMENVSKGPRTQIFGVVETENNVSLSKHTLWNIMNCTLSMKAVWVIR